MKRSQSMGIALGMNIITTFAIGIIGGILWDNKMDTKPIGILVGLATSLLMVGLLMAKFVKMTTPKKISDEK